MPPDRLTALQRRILRVLAPLTPPWTLTGGGALALYLGHRPTRDLDLFWRSRADLGDLVPGVQALLRIDGLQVAVLRTTPAFSELRVSDDEGVCIVDLVAEPFPPIEPPRRVAVEGVEVAVDSMHEILASKLSALLGRSELRDLIDVQALLDAGADLVAALQDAPRKDAGFSAITLAWVLQTLDIGPLARALRWNETDIARIDAFRRQLIERLTELTRPP